MPDKVGKNPRADFRAIFLDEGDLIIFGFLASVGGQLGVKSEPIFFGLRRIIVYHKLSPIKAPGQSRKNPLSPLQILLGPAAMVEPSSVLE